MTDQIAARLDVARSVIDANMFRSDATPREAAFLLAAIDEVLKLHKIEPLYTHADDGKCGCPVPGEYADIADDVAYDGAHPEGHGPEGFGLVCSKKPIAGHWCTGCAEIAVELGCFEAPKDYPPEKCKVREAISRALGGAA